MKCALLAEDANPYLAVSLMLAAGLLGMDEALEPTMAQEEDCWENDSDLPANLELLSEFRGGEPGIIDGGGSFESLPRSNRMNSRTITCDCLPGRSII